MDSCREGSAAIREQNMHRGSEVAASDCGSEARSVNAGSVPESCAYLHNTSFAASLQTRTQQQDQHEDRAGHQPVLLLVRTDEHENGRQRLIDITAKVSALWFYDSHPWHTAVDLVRSNSTGMGYSSSTLLWRGVEKIRKQYRTGSPYQM